MWIDRSMILTSDNYILKHLWPYNPLLRYWLLLCMIILTTIHTRVNVAKYESGSFSCVSLLCNNMREWSSCLLLSWNVALRIWSNFFSGVINIDSFYFLDCKSHFTCNMGPEKRKTLGRITRWLLTGIWSIYIVNIFYNINQSNDNYGFLEMR